MKPFVLGLLALSLVANAVLLTQRRGADARPASARHRAATAVENSHPSRGTAGNATDARSTAALAELAPEFDSADLRELVARLRAAGVSDSLIRAIVSARLDEQFAARRKELTPPPPEHGWWQNRPRVPPDPRRLAALRELSREQSRLLRDILGPEAAGDDSARSWQQRQYGHLSPEKAEQLQRIFADYSDLNAQIQAEAQGILLPEDREKLAYLEQERRADLERLMTPEELAEYDLRTSRTTNTLRNRLGAFEATEQEFRALYQAQKDYDDRFRRPPQPAPPDWTEQRNAAQQQLDAQFAGVLGPERYAEFQQVTDSNYQQVSRLVSRLQLPPSTTDHVLAVQKTAQERASAIRADRALTPVQRRQQLQQLSQEADTALAQSLGATGLEAYKQYGGGWLRTLQRNVNPTPTQGGAP